MGTGDPKIGIFDSGIGGLTVLKECVSLLPEAEFYYLGDNGRAPYGNRSEGEIKAFVGEALQTFRDLGVDAAVLACNTATTVCLDEMRKAFCFPIIGTEPAVRLAARECKSALVLSTVRTAHSERLKALIRSCPACDFTVLPCPDLAGEIERLFRERGKGELVHFPPAERGGYGGVVLGCTHYVFLKREIADFYGCKAFDGNRGVALALGRRLKIGTVFHHVKCSTNQNQNICFEMNLKEKSREMVEFLGKHADFNQSVFYSNICFKSN